MVTALHSERSIVSTLIIIGYVQLVPLKHDHPLFPCHMSLCNHCLRSYILHCCVKCCALVIYAELQTEFGMFQVLSASWFSHSTGMNGHVEYFGKLSTCTCLCNFEQMAYSQTNKFNWSGVLWMSQQDSCVPNSVLLCAWSFQLCSDHTRQKSIFYRQVVTKAWHFRESQFQKTVA